MTRPLETEIISNPTETIQARNPTKIPFMVNFELLSLCNLIIKKASAVFLAPTVCEKRQTTVRARESSVQVSTKHIGKNSGVNLISKGL